MIKELKNLFERELERSLGHLGEDTRLKQACRYALLSGGKRLRPLIVLLVADALGKGHDVMKAALSLEYFHTASLIADDLPCMDNDDMRRDIPSLHRAFDETTALLASYALISAAFENIHRCSLGLLKTGASLAHQACFYALELASVSAGIKGAAGGQYIDLFPPSLSLQYFDELIYKKTVTLFEVAFLFGWIFGGGDFGQMEQIKQIGYHFGRAFQIADDLSDIDQDTDKSVNIALFLGKQEAENLLREECMVLVECMKAALLYTPPLEKIVEKLLQHGLPDYISDKVSAS